MGEGIHFQYPALPERICRVLRMANNWPANGDVTRNEANYCLKIKTDRGIETISFDEAHNYLAAWKSSGLWALHGTKGDDRHD